MSIRVADHERWQRRATRARILAGRYPAAEDTLLFYAALVETQESVLHRHSHAIIGGTGSFADQLDHGAALRALPQLLKALATDAPAALVERLPSISEHNHDRWRHRIQSFWITGGREAWDADEVQRFVLEALLQPFAEAVASAGVPEVPGVPAVPGMRAASDNAAKCGKCSGLPVVAMLREKGHGAQRSLVCGFCLTEWPALRLICPACGESRFEALPIFRAGEFDAVRVDACESCKTHIKTIDLTRDGAACPLVDDLASLPLDLWAQEHGYHRSRPNLLRL